MLPTIISAVDFQYACAGSNDVQEPGDHERREREDRARRHRFADGARRSRDVLFEHGALQIAQHRHADHRRRIGGRDGHARVQAQVGVGRAQHHRHHQAQQHGPQRELLHLHVFGNEGTMLRGHIRLNGR